MVRLDRISPGGLGTERVNDTIKRALTTADFPSILEPVCLDRGDRRPNGMTLCPFRRWRCMIWDATVVDTSGDSHIMGCTISPSQVANFAEEAKRRKYAGLSGDYDFEPLGFETAGFSERMLKHLLQRSVG